MIITLPKKESLKLFLISKPSHGFLIRIIFALVFSIGLVFHTVGQNTQTFSAGSLIIVMGVRTQTVGNGLRDIGQIYIQILSKTSVSSSIEITKTKNGIDFNNERFASTGNFINNETYDIYRVINPSLIYPPLSSFNNLVEEVVLLDKKSFNLFLKAIEYGWMIFGRQLVEAYIMTHKSINS